MENPLLIGAAGGDKGEKSLQHKKKVHWDEQQIYMCFLVVFFGTLVLPKHVTSSKPPEPVVVLLLSLFSQMKERP